LVSSRNSFQAAAEQKSEYGSDKYLVAAALLDDQVGPAQLEELRIQAPDAQALLARVEVHPDERFSARYPRELSAAIVIRTKDKRVFVKEQHGYEGGLNKPMSWDRTVEKFHWLSEAFADEIRVVKKSSREALSFPAMGATWEGPLFPEKESSLIGRTRWVFAAPKMLLLQRRRWQNKNDFDTGLTSVAFPAKNVRFFAAQ
jgi:hypothetical protein